MICSGGPSSMITVVKHSILKLGLLTKFKDVSGSCLFPIPTSDFSSVSITVSGLCRTSEVTRIFPTTSPDIVFREATVEDCWEVAETHCSVFFPDYTFPLDLLLRLDRLVGMLFGFSIPKGCKRTCLVAASDVDALCLEETGFNIGNFSLHKGYIVGILTVDTVADFLPRRRPLRQRRAGIAYISNVAVREEYRRKGIAKKLILKAMVKAKSWGCRAIALHCDFNNEGARELYRSQGFKCIRVPDGANWPQPNTCDDTRFNFMVKLL